VKGNLYLSDISVATNTLYALIPKCEIRISFHNLSISVLKVGRQLVGSLTVAAFFIAFFTSCIKDENAVKPHEIGNVTTRTIQMSPDYTYQIFYNLEKDSVISQNERFEWDIAFQTNPTEGGGIQVNQSKFMSAWVSDEATLTQSSDTFGLHKRMTVDCTNVIDTPAIGRLLEQKANIIFVDLGYDRFGELLGVRKMQIEKISDKILKINHSDIKGKNIQSATITLDENYNAVFFSFNKNKTIKVEPPKKDWDLVFTQYVHKFYNPYQPYLVTGVLLNNYNTIAAKDSTLAFQNIDHALAQNFKMFNKTDIIGYDWKSYINNFYSIRSHVNYIIRDSKGYFYKLHFIDFYDSRGNKGSPKFEFQKL
jgi:HmuY protein